MFTVYQILASIILEIKDDDFKNNYEEYIPKVIFSIISSLQKIYFENNIFIIFPYIKDDGFQDNYIKDRF